ncbi:MAG: hypothetical protein J6Y36_02000 [Treponema sp.]|nr:hypothetical protein [Treponema sp.]
MKKFNYFFSILKSRIVLVFAVIALAFATSGCDSPATVSYSPISEFIGQWENDSYGSVYEISESKIIDMLMDCAFDIVDENPVLSADGYTLFLCKCSKGTSYTPAGNYYAVALKMSGNYLDISCPLDYDLTFTSIDQLKGAYTPSYTIGTNGTTTCSKLSVYKISVTDDTKFMMKCDFAKNNVSVSMMGVDGFSEYDSFTPTRDKSKETGNVVLYLYNSLERQVDGTDLNYCSVVDENGTYYVYWYLYDEDEDDNDPNLEMMYDGTFGENLMPIVSGENLTKLKEKIYK